MSAFDQTTGATLWWRPVGTVATLAYDDGRLFVIDGRFMTAVSAATGETLWTHDFGGTSARIPVAAGGLVYVNYGSSTLYAFEADSGAIRWQRNTGLSGVPSLDARHVYLNRNYYCDPGAFERDTGAPIWTNAQDCSGTEDVVADGARVLVRGQPGILLDGATGGLEDTIVASRLPVSAGSVGVFLNASRLQARNLHTGVAMWEFAGDGYLTSAPLVVNHVAYVGSSKGMLYAVDLATGAQIWSVAAGTASTAVGTAGMAAAQGLLVVPVGGRLVAYADSELTPTPGLDLEIVTGPDGPTASDLATFAFTSSGLAATQCRLDAGAWESCAGSASYADLDDGPHTFEVKTDNGSGDAALAARGFSVDTTGPSAQITNLQPSGPYVKADFVSFDIATEAGASVECRLDDSNWTACPPSGWTYTYDPDYRYTGLTEGEHRLEVRTTDTFGNVRSPADAAEWIQDTVAPSVEITDGPPSPSYSNSATFTFAADEAGATLECQLVSATYGPWSPCTSPRTLTDLGDGTHSLNVRAKDPAGNVGHSTGRTWVVDAVDPETTISRGPEGITRSRDATFEFISNEGGAGFECRLDGSSWTTCSFYGWDYGSQYYTNLPDGDHTFDVRARDQGGSFDGTPDSRTWVVDTQAPRAVLNTQASGPTGLDAARFEFSAAEPDVTFECELDGLGWEGCASPAVYAGLTPTEHTFRVRAIDRLGNVDDVGDEMAFSLAPSRPPEPDPTPQPRPDPALPLVVAPAPQAPTAPASDAAFPSPTTPRLAARGMAAYLRATPLADLLRARTVAFPYQSGTAGALSMTVVARGQGGREVMVGSAKKRFRQPGLEIVSLRIRAKARRLLNGRRRAAMSIRVRFHGDGGHTRTVTRRATTG